MKAQRVHQFGPPQSMVWEELEAPVPGPGQVLVRVRACGVGPWDGWVRSGKSLIEQPLPLTPGSDLAGVVEQSGPDSPWQPGELVFGVTNPRFTGAYAELALAESGMLARKPEALDFVRAAALPVVAVTAWQELFDYGEARPGQTVLVHGAGGSVGGCAVQLAHRHGLRVVATCGVRDRERVQALGADLVLDSRHDRLEEIDPVDLVLDNVGGELQERSFAALKPGGSLVSAVSQPAQDRGVRALVFLVEVTTLRLDRVAHLEVPVGVVLPLEQARVAHEMLEGIRPRPHGKIVLQV